MRRSKFRRPNNVLIFNGARVLVVVVRSLCSAAELTNNRASTVITVARENTPEQGCIITGSFIQMF